MRLLILVLLVPVVGMLESNANTPLGLVIALVFDSPPWVAAREWLLRLL